MTESVEIFETADIAIEEGKKKIKKVVKDADGKFHKKITFTCDGDGEKFDANKKKCVHVSGSEKANKRKGAKRRAKTLKRIPQSVKDKNIRMRDKAKSKFGIK